MGVLTNSATTYERAMVSITQRNTVAQVRCWASIRDRVKYPSKAKFDPGLFNVAQVGRLNGQPGVIAVRGNVDLMNGFGALIPHQYGCDVKNGRVIRADVTP